MPQAKYIRGTESAEINVEIVDPSNPGSATDAMVLVKTADLSTFLRKTKTANPIPGDKLQVGDEEYIVDVPFPDFSCYGFSKSDNVDTRIHVKTLS